MDEVPLRFVFLESSFPESSGNNRRYFSGSDFGRPWPLQMMCRVSPVASISPSSSRKISYANRMLRLRDSRTRVLIRSKSS